MGKQEISAGELLHTTAERVQEIIDSWDEDEAEGGDRCRARTADGTPESCDGYGDDREPPRHSAGKRFHKLNDAGRYPGAFHYEAGKNEERYGEQGKFRDAGEEVVGKHIQAHVPLPCNEHGGESEGKGYRYPQQQRDQKADKKPERGVMETGAFHSGIT